MFQKSCRLSRASTYYGGGSGGGTSDQPYYPQGGAGSMGFTGIGAPGSITQNEPGVTGGGTGNIFPTSGGSPFGGPAGGPRAGGNLGGLIRTPSNERQTIGNWYDAQINAKNQFQTNDPLLGPAQGGALSFWNQLPGMLGQFKGFGNELSGDQSQIRGYQGQLGQQYGTLGNWLNQSGVANTITSQGALTDQQSRDVAQQTRGIQSAQGTAGTNAALGNELLNRDQYRQQRLATALQQGQGLLGQQQGLTQAGAGLTSELAGLTGQKAGLLGQQQALQTGGINQLLGVSNAGVSQFGGLTNPILGYLSSLFGGNQQSAIAQAQIQAQQQAAGQSKKAGGTSAAGSILSAAIPAIIGL